MKNTCAREGCNNDAVNKYCSMRCFGLDRSAKQALAPVPVNTCALPTCNAPLPKGHTGKYCPKTDHFPQHMALKRAVSAEEREEQSVSIASRTTTTETVFAAQYKVERSRAFFEKTQEELRQTREDSEREDKWSAFEHRFSEVGAALIPVIMAIAIGADIAVFLWKHSGETNPFLNLPLLFLSIGFEIALAALTYHIRGLLKDKTLAPESMKESVEQRFRSARTGWFFLAIVSSLAQFAAITGADLTGLNLLVGTVIAVRVLGTTGVDGVIALCFAPRVKTPAMRVAELRQEADDLLQLAGAMRERLIAEGAVRLQFLELDRPAVGSVNGITEVPDANDSQASA